MSENKPSRHHAHYNIQYVRDLTVPDYKKHPEIIKPFVDSLAEYSDALIVENEVLYEENEKLELDNRLVKTENASLREINKRIVGENTFKKLISAVGGVFFAFGVGIAFSTSDHSSPLGWFLIVSGLLLTLGSIISFRFFAKQILEEDLQIAKSAKSEGDDE